MRQPALAPLADEELFALMLEHPCHRFDGQYEAVYRDLGESLREHPAAAPLLLKAYDGTAAGQVRFAREVFGHAGKDLLPVLHKALASDDRVVRSNAALACGAVGDGSSIAPLIAPWTWRAAWRGRRSPKRWGT